MNKKIYFNTRYIQVSEGPVQPSENQLIIDADSAAIDVLNDYLKSFIQQNDKNNLILMTKNVDSTFSLVKKQFVVIEAAGGLIRQGTKYLFIYRFKKWDLPKGKLDKGETIQHAAIRECEEECAIKELKIIKELEPTYHIYAYKNGFALKTSHWFLMESNYKGVLIPQVEENIEFVEWMDKGEIIEKVLKNSYPAILDVLSLGIE